MNVVREIGECDISGLTPQQVIRKMNDVIGRAKQNEKDKIRIIAYYETYGNQFNQNPDKCLKFVVVK